MITLKVGAIDLGYGAIKCASRVISIEGGQIVKASPITTSEFLSRAARVERRGKVSLGIKMAKHPSVEFLHPTEKEICRYRVGDPDDPVFLSPSSRQVFWQYPDIYAMICYSLSLIAKPNDNITVIYGVPAGWLEVYKKAKTEKPPSVFKFSVLLSDDSSPKTYQLSVQSSIGGQTIGGARFILSNFPFVEQLDKWAIVDVGYGTTDVVIMQYKKPPEIPSSLDYGISNELARQRYETGHTHTNGGLNESAYSRIAAKISTEIMHVERAYNVRKVFLIGGGGEIIASRTRQGKNVQIARDIKLCDWKKGFTPGDDIQVIVPPNPRMVNCIGLLEMLCLEIAKRNAKSNEEGQNATKKERQ